MAYIKDKEFIYNKMLTNNLNYYRVLDSDNKTVLDSQQDSDCGVDEAVNRLRDTLDNLTGLVNIVLSAKSGAEKAQGGANPKGDIKLTIKLTDGDAKGINGLHQDQSLRADELRAAIVREYEAKLETQETRHKAEIERLKTEHANEKRFRELQDQIKELKENDMTKDLMPVISGLLSGQGSNALAGIPAEPHITGPGETVSPKERMVAAINTILKTDKNFVAHLEMLAALSEKSPVVYHMAISELKKHVK